MSIVLQFDRRSQKTYAYHNEVIWNKEMKRSESTRTLIGKIGDNGEIVPTSGTKRRHQLDEALVQQEIDEYNAAIQKKKEAEQLQHSPEGMQLRELKENFMKIQKQHEEISKLLHSFVESVDRVLIDK